MDAILYSRWSSLEQKGTTSAPRQLEITQSVAARLGFRVVERMVDSGKSAWTGDNIVNGNLGKLAQRLQRDGGKDKVLIVEKLDRLSRQKPRIMARWIETMVLTGLTIMTADGRHTIDEAALDNPMVYMTMIFEGFRAYEESETKSVRVAEANRLKRERGKPMTRLCPGWLTISAGDTCYKSVTNQTAQYRVIEHRGEIVRWMFEQAKTIGAATIANLLNARGEPVWGRGDGWHASYVKKILANPAVIGEYQPHTKPKGHVRLPAGEPIRDYFPAVVPIALFNAINDKRQVRIRREQSGHNRLVNMFAGLASCAHCGGSMTFLDKGAETLATGQIMQRQYLKCSRVHRSLGGCSNKRSFNYAVAQNAILDELLHRAMDDQHFAQVDSVAAIEVDVARLARDLADAERRQGASFRMVEDDSDDELAAARYRQHRNAAKSIKHELLTARATLSGARGKVSPTEHIRRVSEVRAMMDHHDDDVRYQARSRIKLALNDLIEGVSFSDKKHRIAVKLTGGIRFLSFDLTGRKADCDDLTWDVMIGRQAQTNATVAGYARRSHAV